MERRRRGSRLAQEVVVPPGDGGGRSKAWLPIVALVLAAVIGVVAFMLLTGGDDGGDDDAGTTTTTTTGSDTTDNTEPSGTCTSSSGRCAFIDDITPDGDGFVAAYSTAGFEPLIAGDDSDHHLHFFFEHLSRSTRPVCPAAGPGRSGTSTLMATRCTGAPTSSLRGCRPTPPSSASWPRRRSQPRRSPSPAASTCRERPTWALRP